MNNKDWKSFEKECLDYLVEKYGSIADFTASGGSDSTASDIIVWKNGEIITSIEAKSSDAQCGQFVLFPNTQTKNFDFQNNKSSEEIAKKIITHMNAHFELYKNPGTSGVDINVPIEVMYDWVKNYYREVKGSEFFITEYMGEKVIFPIEKLDTYLNISCKYRVKKSGSSHPSNNNLKEIKEILSGNNLNYSELNIIEGKTYVKIEGCGEDFLKLDGPNYRYQFTKIGDVYNVRRLSNTANANVIFSVSSMKTQGAEDLREFEDFLKRAGKVVYEIPEDSAFAMAAEDMLEYRTDK